MKKTTPYARKRAVQHRQQASTILVAAIRADLTALQIDAGIHTWTGNDGANMVNLAGRLCFLTAYAAKQSGMAVDESDVRIVRGMAEALGDLAADLRCIEQHRPSIQSGLAAIDRILPQCDILHVVQGARDLDAMLQASRGMGTADVREALGVPA